MKSTLNILFLLLLFVCNNPEASAWQTNTETPTPDITIVSAPKSCFVILGEPFETEITLLSNTAKLEDYQIEVVVDNYMTTRNKDHFDYQTFSWGQPGKRTYQVKALLQHRQTGAQFSITRDFTYETGHRSIAVQADKMSVFYIGVDNPFTASMAGIASKDVRVYATGGGATVTSAGSSRYTVNVTTPGTTQIRVESKEGLNATFQYRVKRIPDPKALLGARYGSKSIKADEFKHQLGMSIMLENFDFEVFCFIVDFEIVRIRPNGVKETLSNRGARFTEEATALIQQAAPGDIFLFNNIKSECPGDTAPRNLGSLVFMIE